MRFNGRAMAQLLRKLEREWGIDRGRFFKGSVAIRKRGYKELT